MAILTDAKMEAIAELAVNKTLLAIGIDITTSEGVISFQQDMHYLRNHRIRESGLRSHAVDHGITVIITGTIAAMVMGVISFFSGNR